MNRRAVVNRKLDWYNTIIRVGRHYSILQYTSLSSAITEHLNENGEQFLQMLIIFSGVFRV
jgi:hypothetical protein